MGANDNGDLGFQQRGGGRLLDCPPSGMYATPQSENVAGITMSSMPMCKSSNVVDSFFGSGWDPFVSQAQNGEFKISSVASSPQIAISPYSVGVLENQGISSSSHLVHYPSDPALVDLARFGSGSFSEMVSSFGLSECGQIVNSDCPDYPSSNKEVGKTSASSRNGGGHGSIFQEDHHHSVDEGSGGTSAGEKRRRTPETHYQFNSIQSAEAEQQNDVSVESLEGLEEQDKKKQKTEQNRVNLCGKVTGKQAKDNSQIGEAPKEDYIHVRARRGQATNSHSLAERVRREKISERMRFLQDLVPGCNKITGKAVMLDEIINYVQSLQRQVEFLSMKLATVNPELNIDIERILSKDIRAGGSSILGFAPGMSSSLPHPHIIAQGALPPIQRTNLQLTPMLQIPSVWDDELQRVLQLGFISNPNLDNLEQNGCTKVEL